jgi:signal recognition particle receptor subunit beta
MSVLRLAIAAALTASASAAQATTVIIYVEPMTMERYTRVFDTPGRDRFLMCPAPPAAGSCTELPIKHRR